MRHGGRGLVIPRHMLPQRSKEPKLHQSFFPFFAVSFKGEFIFIF